MPCQHRQWVAAVLLLLSIALALSMLVFDAHANRDAGDSMEAKQIRAQDAFLNYSNKTPLVKITEKGFEKFLVGDQPPSTEPDDHMIVLLITSFDAKACPFCTVLNQYCNETAIAFHKKYKGNDEDRKKATFLIMEYTANTRHIPPQFQISALPAIVVFPRFHDNRNFEVINLMELDLAQLIKERTGLDVDKVEKKFDLGGKNDAGTPGTPKEDEKSLITNYLLVLVCFIACYVGYTLLKYLLGTSVLRYLTIFGAMVAYYLLTGGIMYNIITQAEPFFVHPQTKQMFLIFPNARRQFSVETYIVGLITFALSASFIAMHSYVVKCNQSLEKEDSSNANKEEVNKSGEDASSKNKKKKEPAASTEDVAIERAEASSSSASKDSGVGANNNNNKAPAAYEGNLPYFVGLFSIFFVGFLFLNFIHAAKLPGYLEGSWLRKALLLPDI